MIDQKTLYKINKKFRRHQPTFDALHAHQKNKLKTLYIQKFWNIETEAKFEVLNPSNLTGCKLLENAKFLIQTESGSNYYYNDDYIIRLSNHWGKIGRSDWNLKLVEGDDVELYDVPIYGIAYFRDFKVDWERVVRWVINQASFKNISPAIWLSYHLETKIKDLKLEEE